VAQCDFFMAEADEDRLVRWIFAREAVLVPDLDYGSPHYQELRNADALHGLRSRTNLFFVLHSSFYRCPLELRTYSSGAKAGGYYLMQRNGGPALSLFCPTTYKKEGARYLPAGMASYFPTFWNPEREENENAPQELVGFYRSLVAAIKHDAVCRKVGKRTYWIGEHAMTQFREGDLHPGMEIEI
jgi:hypothetical protein